MESRDVIPPPPLEMLHKLQLMRFTLVRLMNHRLFGDIVQGCYVRVLLEMRGPNRQPGDNYFIVQVKGVQRGPAYSGFSWDGHQTEWHLVIELPPTLRNTNSTNSNVIQMNSISNSPFSQNEYDEWLRMHREANTPCVSAPQLQLRYDILREHIESVEARRVLSAPVAPGQDMIREQAHAAVISEYVILPRAEALSEKTHAELLQIERECLKLIAETRTAIMEREQCFHCHKRPRTVVCYPCKHQSLCEECVVFSKICPVPACGAEIASSFVPFTS
jgi:hypothetical protein